MKVWQKIFLTSAILSTFVVNPVHADLLTSSTGVTIQHTVEATPSYDLVVGGFDKDDYEVVVEDAKGTLDESQFGSDQVSYGGYTYGRTVTGYPYVIIVKLTEKGLVKVKDSVGADNLASIKPIAKLPIETTTLYGDSAPSREQKIPEVDRIVVIARKTKSSEKVDDQSILKKDIVSTKKEQSQKQDKIQLSAEDQDFVKEANLNLAAGMDVRANDTKNAVKQSHLSDKESVDQEKKYRAAELKEKTSKVAWRMAGLLLLVVVAAMTGSAMYWLRKKIKGRKAQ